MRFGLALPQYGFSLPNGDVGFETTAAWARRAEELGFDSVWLSDHFFYTFARYGGDPTPIPAIEPMTALAGLAAITSRVRLGTLVLCAPFRHPALLTKMAVTIDRLSGGRLDLGLGAGWLQEEFDAFGFPFGSVGDRFAALEDALAALSALAVGRCPELRGSDRDVARRVDAPRAGERPHAGLGRWEGRATLTPVDRASTRTVGTWCGAWIRGPTHRERRPRAMRSRPPRATQPRSASPWGCTRWWPRTRPRPRRRSSAAARGSRAARWMPTRGRRGAPTRLSGTPDQVIERVRWFEELGVEEIIVSPSVLPFAVDDPEIAGLLAGARHRAAPRRLLMDPLDAAVAVLREAGEPLHWTVIQDRALRQGLDRSVRGQRRASDAVASVARRRSRAACWCEPRRACTAVGGAGCRPDRRLGGLLPRAAATLRRRRLAGPPSSSARTSSRAEARPATAFGRPRRGLRAPATNSLTCDRAEVFHEVASRGLDGDGFRGRLAAGVADEDRFLSHFHSLGLGSFAQDIGSGSSASRFACVAARQRRYGIAENRSSFSN